MKADKKDLLKEWWNNNLDYLPLGAKWRGKWQKGAVTNIIKEIDERKLDIEVAEKLFGYKVKVKEASTYSDESGDNYRPELQMLVKVHKGGNYDRTNWGEYETLPYYSTDMNDAWLVVNEIGSHSWEVSVTLYAETKENEVKISKVEVDEEYTHNTIGPLYILGDSAPNAICLAGLRVTEYGK